MIGAVVGLLTLLCALVTGLLIWTAYGVYAGQNLAIQTVASKVLQLDQALADYGPEANAERAALRDRLGETIDQVWGTRVTDPNFAADSFAAALRIMRDPEKEIGNLQPSTDAQRQALAAAKAAIEAIGQSRLQMAFALTAPVSYPLLLTVVGWVFCLFCGFGLMSRGGVMPVLALAVGASAVASAVLLNSRPFKSLLRHVSRLRRPARTGPGGDGERVIQLYCRSMSQLPKVRIGRTPSPPCQPSCARYPAHSRRSANGCSPPI